MRPTVSLHFSLENVNIYAILYMESDLQLHPHQMAKQDAPMLKEGHRFSPTQQEEAALDFS